MDYVTRDIEATLKRHIESSAEHKSVILIDGARQVGKSRLVEHVLASIRTEKVQINLEVDALLRSRIDECRQFSDFNDLLADEFKFSHDRETTIYIDEAQESLRLGRFVRSMKEEWKRVTTVLSGSSLSRLFRAGTRFPVGRIINMTLRPFSFAEYMRGAGRGEYVTQLRERRPRISTARHESLLRHLDTFLITGGLPEIVLASINGTDSGKMHRQMIASYEQDFLRLLGEDRYQLTKECLRSVANIVGFPSKLSSVSPYSTTNTVNNVKEIFARLEEWNLILKSPQFGSSATSSHKYLPKRYLFDTGILRFLRESSVPSIGVLETLDSASRTPLGGIIENQTAIDISTLGYELSGWKKSPSGMEIDFVVKRPDRVLPVECKATLRLNRRHLKGMLEYMRLHSLNTGIVISLSPFQTIKMDGRTIVNLPLYMTDYLANLSDPGS